MGFLIDTCIWIEGVERGAVAPADVAAFTGQESVFRSPVTLAELTFGVERATDPKIRLKRIFSTSPGWTWSYSPSLLSSPSLPAGDRNFSSTFYNRILPFPVFQIISCLMP